SVEDTNEAPTGQQLPTIYASPALLDLLLAGEQTSSADVLHAAQQRAAVASFTLDPKKVLRFNVSVATERQYTQNVVGVLEGRDKLLKQEYVAVGAHYDHIGLCPPVNGHNIWNGPAD